MASILKTGAPANRTVVYGGAVFGFPDSFQAGLADHAQARCLSTVRVLRRSLKDYYIIIVRDYPSRIIRSTTHTNASRNN